MQDSATRNTTNQGWGSMPLINSTAIPELGLKAFGRNLILAAKFWCYINTITFEKVQYIYIKILLLHQNQSILSWIQFRLHITIAQCLIMHTIVIYLNYQKKKNVSMSLLVYKQTHTIRSIAKLIIMAHGTTIQLLTILFSWNWNWKI